MTTQEPVERPARAVVRPEEAAEMLSVSRSTVYGMLAAGELDSFRIGGSRRIAVATINEYVARKLGADIAEVVLHGSPPRALPVDIETVAGQIAARVAERLMGALGALAVPPAPRY